jgi:hypothetical protein
MSAIDHCKHGTYVGGCGIDWMCHPCEMGDPDPTVNEIITEHHAALTELGQAAVVMAKHFGTGEVHQMTLAKIIDMIAQHERTIAEIRQWAENDDDNNWMRKRHAAAIQAERDSDERERREYTEIDEIHEYGMVPG